MSIRTVTREDVGKRSRVHELVRVRPDDALELARTIQHPWYRCQSLTTVAEHYRDRHKKLKLLREALAVAQTQDEINRIVTVSSWPLRILVSLSFDETKEHLVKLVAQADTEGHPLRRADALFALTNAVRANPDMLDIAMSSLAPTLLVGYGWRIDRLIRGTILIIESSHPEIVASLIAHHTENRKKRQFVVSLGRSGNTDG